MENLHNYQVQYSRQDKFSKKTLGLYCAMLFSGHSFFTYAYANTVNNLSEQETENSALLALSTQFDTSFLSGGVNIDPSLFNLDGQSPLVGDYLVDVFINSSFLQTLMIKFVKDSNNEIKACIPVETLSQAGVKEELLKSVSAQQCVLLNDVAPGATEEFQSSNLSLTLNIPTVFLNKRSNSAPPSQWTYGVNAAFINYYANYYRNTQKNNIFSRGADNSTFVNFNTGINFEKWRLRSQITYSNRGNRRFDTNSTYIQRALPKIRSEITLGQTYTSGLLFDGVSFRGLRLSSDERMLPQNQRGYAPIITGTANSNALVQIRQGNVLIRELTVPPGPFYISDLDPLYNSDLDVEVHEENGSVQRFIVPATAINQALRAGLSRYSFSLGETHERNRHNTVFEEFTFERGITNYLTLNTGFQVSNNDYLSATVGAIVPTRLGTFGLNAYYSYLNKYEKKDGMMYKASFTRDFPTTGTKFSFVYQHRDKKSYATLLDSLDYENGKFRFEHDKKYQKIETYISQNLFDLGAVYGNAIFQNYHDHKSFDTDYRIGYTNSVGWLGYNVYFSQQKKRDGYKDESVSLFLSFPLGSHRLSPSISTGITYNTQDHTGRLQASAYGRLDDDNSLNYSVTATRELKNNHDTSVGATINKATSFGQYSLSYTKGESNSQFSANAQGSLVLHSGGILFGQSVNETFAIIEAKHAYGATLDTTKNVRINKKGFAILPSLSPYNYNRVALNPAEMVDMNVDLKQTEHYIAPYSGAITKVSFATIRGTTLLISANTSNGEPLPIGAIALDDLGLEVGMVGQGSQIFARVQKTEGELVVRWGPGYYQQCKLSYKVDEPDIDTYMTPIDGVCQLNDD